MQKSWNSARVEISSLVEFLLGYMNTSTHVEHKIFQLGLKSKTSFAVYLYAMIYHYCLKNM